MALDLEALKIALRCWGFRIGVNRQGVGVPGFGLLGFGVSGSGFVAGNLWWGLWLRGKAFMRFES